MQMTDKTTNLLADTLNDFEEPFSYASELTAKKVTECLTSVLAAGASQAIGASGETQSSSKVVTCLLYKSHSNIAMFIMAISLCNNRVWFDYLYLQAEVREKKLQL